MRSIISGLMIGLGVIATPILAQHNPQGTPPVAQQSLSISGAFARATPPRAPVAGAFLTVTNHSGRDDRLVGASAPAIAGEVQIHQMTMNNGVMTMRQLGGGLPVAAGQEVRLAPGGGHLMLMGLKQALKEGERIEITLHFEHAGDVTVTFDILARNASSSAAHAGFDQSSVHGGAARITGPLKSMLETVGSPLDVTPMLIDGATAVTGWSQGDQGGRALLRRMDDGIWRVSICAGDGLKGEANMISMGLDAQTSARLVKALAEAKLPAEHVARFALLDGVMRMEGH